VISSAWVVYSVKHTMAFFLIACAGQGGNRGVKLERLWETVWAFWHVWRCLGLTWFMSRCHLKPWALATSSTNRTCTRMMLLTESKPERSSFSWVHSGRGSRLDARPEDCIFTCSCTNYRLSHITPNPLPTLDGSRNTSASAKSPPMIFQPESFSRLERKRSRQANPDFQKHLGLEEFRQVVRPYVLSSRNDHPLMPYVLSSEFSGCEVRPYVLSSLPWQKRGIRP
jgi:hypothetical protein